MLNKSLNYCDNYDDDDICDCGELMHVETTIGRERPREDLPHWINQAAPELYEACEEFVRKCEYAENFVAKVEKALDRAAKEEARRGGEGVQK